MFFDEKKYSGNQTMAFDKHYPNSAPSRQMVEKWIAELKRGRTSTNDAGAVDDQMRLLFQKTSKKSTNWL